MEHPPTEERTELESHLGSVSLKNRIRAKKIVAGLTAGKTFTQIAEELGLGRNTLYAMMSKTEVQQLMVREVTELETKLHDWIEELHNSKSPANQRHATSELGKIVKHVQDKLYPSIFRHETINVNIDLNKLQTIEQQIYETLNRLPPNTRTQFWDTWNQVTQEWKTTPLTTPLQP